MPVTPCMSSSLWMRQERAQRYWPACSRGRPGQRGGDVTLCAETTDSFTAMLLLFHVTLHVFGPYWMAYRKLFSNTRREKCRLVMMLFGTTYASSMLFWSGTGSWTIQDSQMCSSHCTPFPQSDRGVLLSMAVEGLWQKSLCTEQPSPSRGGSLWGHCCGVLSGMSQSFQGTPQPLPPLTVHYCEHDSDKHDRSTS